MPQRWKFARACKKKKKTGRHQLLATELAISAPERRQKMDKNRGERFNTSTLPLDFFVSSALVDMICRRERRKQSEKITYCTERVRRRTQDICAAQKGATKRGVAAAATAESRVPHTTDRLGAVDRQQPAILARNSTPAGVKLTQDCIGTRGPH